MQWGYRMVTMQGLRMRMHGGDEAAGDVDGDVGAVDGNEGCELVVVVVVVQARVRRGAARQRRGLPST